MEPIQKLWNGFDTVKIGLGVAWPASFVKLLETLDKHKQMAMDAMEPVVFALGSNRPFDQVVALEKGTRNARYGVELEGLKVFFSSRELPHADTPNLYVEAGPCFVAERGLGELYGFILELIAQLGGTYLWNKVSEVHMTVDFEVDQPHTDADYRIGEQFAFVTRARIRAQRYGCSIPEETQDDDREETALFYKGSRLETMQVGKNQMMLRIYDKVAEMARRPRKAWERLLWTNCTAEHVMRVEFQVRREPLKLLGFNAIEDLLERSDHLWAYLSQKWFRLYARAEVQKGKKPVMVLHPFWLAVQEAWDIDCEPAQRRKEFHELRVQRAQQLFGHATSLAAILPPSEREDVKNLDELLVLMNKLLRELVGPVDLPQAVQDKAIRFQCRNKADIA